MKKLISLMILVVPSILWAQDATFQSDLKGVILYTADQVTSLAEAIPEDKYDYSPSEGAERSQLPYFILHPRITFLE